MNCSDLERYLEACLDGQLGESRRRALHDHLTICSSCRDRVDGLRHFEADLQRRLRAMQHESSLWQPLGLQTVGSTVPMPLPTPAPGLQETPSPRRPQGNGHPLRLLPVRSPAGPSRWRLQNLAGAALLVAAVAALTNMALSGLGWLGGDKRQAVYRAYLDGDLQLDLRTGDPGELEPWLAEQLAAPVDLPDAPASFALVGGEADPSVLPDGSVMAVYGDDAGPALLFIEALDDAAPIAGGAPQLAMQDGLTTLKWQDHGNAYSLLSALPADKLALFAAD